MKYINLTYAEGREEKFLTTNDKAAAIAAQFCKSDELVVEQFEYEFDYEDESEWFLRREQRIVPSSEIVCIAVKGSDPFDNDEELNILASD